MYAAETKTLRFAKPVLADQKEDLYSLLEAGINDINNGYTLTEEEMDSAIDLM
jgi:uncharacterized protein YlxP (DUF503 family)